MSMVASVVRIGDSRGDRARRSISHEETFGCGWVAVSADSQLDPHRGGAGAATLFVAADTHPVHSYLSLRQDGAIRRERPHHDAFGRGHPDGEDPGGATTVSYVDLSEWATWVHLVARCAPVLGTELQRRDVGGVAVKFDRQRV